MKIRITQLLATIFTQKQKTILSAAAVIMVTVLLSRILGLFRDRLLATYFSVDELGVYFAAFRLPNMIFELLVMGTLSTAFIPVFSKYLVNEDKKDAFSMAANVMNLGIVVLVLLIIPFVVFARPISKLMTPGFSDAQLDTMTMFTQIMLMGQLVPLVIGNFVTGMLQSFQRFLVPALAPVVYNIGIILGIVILAKPLGLLAAVWGVVIGAILYLLIQLPLLLNMGYRHHWGFNRNHPGAREVLKLMLPRTFGLGVSQIDTTVDLILTSLLGARSITIVCI